MSENHGNRTPKTLADVSHLFFSGTGPQEDSGPDGSAGPCEQSSEFTIDAMRASAPTTRLFVVTGGEGGPGKSTVAVNIAQALVAHGRVGLYDADAHIPNARFYLGLPSWNYLSPLTGGGVPAPNVLDDSGLVVVDGTPQANRRRDASEPAGLVNVDLPRAGRSTIDFAVVDCPLSAVSDVVDGTGLPPRFVVVARPGERGFFEAYSVLSTLSRQVGAHTVGLVVNRAPSTSYSRAFHAKTRLAAQRLLSMDVIFLGGVVDEPDLGALQRERGVMVRSRPDATSALLLREIASNALGLREVRVAIADGSDRLA